MKNTKLLCCFIIFLQLAANTNGQNIEVQKSDSLTKTALLTQIRDDALWAILKQEYIRAGWDSEDFEEGILLTEYGEHLVSLNGSPLTNQDHFRVFTIYLEFSYDDFNPLLYCVVDENGQRIWLKPIELYKYEYTIDEDDLVDWDRKTRRNICLLIRSDDDFGK